MRDKHRSHNLRGFIHFPGFTLLIFILALLFTAQPGAARPERIVVGSGDSFRPMIFVNEQGAPDGIYVELWRLWSEKTGVHVEFKLMDWSLVIPALLNEEIDVVDGVTYTGERAQFMDFSEPHDYMKTYIFFHKDLYGIKSLDDLQGFPVGVLKGTSLQEYLENNGKDMRLMLYDNQEQLVNAALNGQIRVFVTEEPMISFYFSKAGSWGGFRRVQKPVLTSDIRVGVRKGETELLALVQGGMDQISRAEHDRIVNKWAGVRLGPRIPWQWILAGAAALLLIVAGVVVWNRQLTRQVAAATQTLRQSQERFLQVAESAQEWIWEVDANGLYTYCSPPVEQILGYTADEMVGKKHFHDLFHPDNKETVKRIADEYFKKMKPFYDFVNRNIHKNGSVVWLSTSGIPMIDAGGDLLGYRGVDADITQKRKNEQELEAHREHLEELVAERTQALEKANAQLLQSQKMEAIGVLSGGMAHDFNNILASISGTAELLQRKTEPDHAHARLVRRILRSAERARDLTMKLLTFARKEKLDVQTVDINDIVADVADMLKTIPPSITLNTRLAGALPRITVDRNQIAQALLNICLNACDAIADSGTITIETLEKHWHEPAPGQYCAVRVTDTGTGMDPDVQDKIFEPFFTTKERGKGTGLGLSVTLGIIQSHGGAINIQSQPGRGTQFEILLPVAGDLAPLPADTRDADDTRNPAATILVVDDDEDFMGMICENLELDGFRVLQAADGAQAIRIFSEHRDAVDLVILDMLMPDMDGSQVFHELRGMDPDARVLLCSGFSVEGHATDLLQAGACGFLQKPFQLKELAQGIAQALEI